MQMKVATNGSLSKNLRLLVMYWLKIGDIPGVWNRPSNSSIFEKGQYMGQYSLQYSGFAEKQICYVLQVLPKTLYTQDINDAPQVVSGHHEPHIRTGPFWAFFCHNVAKPPLPF